MRIGIMPPTGTPVATPEHIATVARAADDLGFHSLWAPEHVVFFEEYHSRYPYTEDGQLNMRIGGPIDPLQVLTFAAAVTRNMRLGTGILLVPQRNPVYTAKEIAGLDWLSGGRVDLGVGIGWLREEFQALGVPWANRAARTREHIELMQRLWADGPAEYHGQFYDLPRCFQHPKPIQQPHPPIHFGGESDAALRRVADQGQGWFGFNLDPEQAHERIAALVALLASCGRSRRDITISISPFRRSLTPELVDQYRQADVDQLIVPVGGREPLDTVSRLERLAELLLGSE